MGADECFHLFQVTFLSCTAGFDDHFVAPFAVVFANQELPDGETEKVKTCATFVFVERVRDVGFGRFQRQPHFGQPFLDQKASGQQLFQVFTEDDKIVCEADDDWPVALGEGFCQGCFETMQGDVGEQR